MIMRSRSPSKSPSEIGSLAQTKNARAQKRRLPPRPSYNNVGIYFIYYYHVYGYFNT